MKSMKNWLVKLYQPEAESVKWRFLFSFLGVESTPLRNEKELIRSLIDDPTGLVVIDHNLLGEAFSTIESFCSQWLERGGGIALTGQTTGLWLISSAFLARVTDISSRDPFTINHLLQLYLPNYSRQHPRLGTRLPGLYARINGSCQICEVINLSPGGAFIRTTESLPLYGEEVQLNLPLIGLHKEIEINGHVVSQLLPNEANNFVQGIGVRFIGDENAPVFEELNNYVKYVIANDATLELQVSPFLDCKSKKIGHDVKVLATRSPLGRERRLVANC